MVLGQFSKFVWKISVRNIGFYKGYIIDDWLHSEIFWYLTKLARVLTDYVSDYVTKTTKTFDLNKKRYLYPYR